MKNHIYKYSSLMLIGLGVLSVAGCFDSGNDGSPSVETNEPPVANDIALITQTETPVTDSLPASDPDGDALRFGIMEMTSLGNIVLDDQGNFTYTPNPEVTGVDSFVYSVSDGNSSLVTGMIQITIEALQVSFREQSRLAFSQSENAQPLVLNGRSFIQDVNNQDEYQDLIDAN